MKNIIILRGTSSSGKSSFAKLLCQQIGWIECNADFFFEDKEGNYNFDFNKIGDAHAQCRKSFMEALKESTVTGIVVSNTNVEEKQWKFYEDEAKKVGGRVTFLVIEKRHDGENNHNVPETSLQSQEDRIRNSLKLR